MNNFLIPLHTNINSATSSITGSSAIPNTNPNTKTIAITNNKLIVIIQSSPFHYKGCKNAELKKKEEA